MKHENIFFIMAIVMLFGIGLRISIDNTHRKELDKEFETYKRLSDSCWVMNWQILHVADSLKRENDSLKKVIRDEKETRIYF